MEKRSEAKSELSRLKKFELHLGLLAESLRGEGYRQYSSRAARPCHCARREPSPANRLKLLVLLGTPAQLEDRSARANLNLVVLQQRFYARRQSEHPPTLISPHISLSLDLCLPRHGPLRCPCSAYFGSDEVFGRDTLQL